MSIILLSSSGFEFSIFPSRLQFFFVFTILMTVYVLFYKHFSMLINYLGGSNGNVIFHYIDILADVFVFFCSFAFCYLPHGALPVWAFCWSSFSSWLSFVKQFHLSTLVKHYDQRWLKLPSPLWGSLNTQSSFVKECLPSYPSKKFLNVAVPLHIVPSGKMCTLLVIHKW